MHASERSVAPARGSSGAIKDARSNLFRDLLHQTRLGVVDALASLKAPRRPRSSARLRLQDAGEAQFIFASDEDQEPDELIAVIDLRADTSRLV